MNSLMKIAVVNTEKDRGGAAKIAAMLTDGYNNVPSISATMYHAGSSDLADKTFHGVKIVGARQMNAGLFRMSGRDELIPLDVSKRIGALIADSDVLHLHNPHGYYIDYVALLKEWGSKPIVWTWHDAWGATGRCAYPQDCENWKSGCKSCPNMSYYPASYNDKAAQNFSRRFKAFASAENLKIVSPSEWLAAVAVERGYSAGKVHVVSNPVDVELYAGASKQLSRETLDIRCDKPVLLFVAAQCDDPRKGYTDFCTATKKLNTLNIAIGHPPQQPSDHVVHTGNILDAEVMGHYYAIADLLVVPSYADNYPNVVLEAMASGTPAIGYNVGGLQELLCAPYSNGVDVGDQHALKCALEAWLAKQYDSEEVNNVLKQHAKAQWHTEVVVNAYLRLMGLK